MTGGGFHSRSSIWARFPYLALTVTLMVLSLQGRLATTGTRVKLKCLARATFRRFAKFHPAVLYLHVFSATFHFSAYEEPRFSCFQVHFKQRL